MFAMKTEMLLMFHMASNMFPCFTPLMKLLSNSVIASNAQSGQQDMGQCVSDSDYPGLNTGPSIYGHKSFSHTFHTNGHDGLNQISHENPKGLNTNILNENQDRVNTDCSDHCKRSHVKLIYDTKYCGF